MLDKQTTIDRIEVLPESGHIQIRQKIAIIETTGEGEDAVSNEISYSYHRYVLEKDSDLTNQPSEVVAIALAAWGQGED